MGNLISHGAGGNEGKTNGEIMLDKIDEWQNLLDNGKTYVRAIKKSGTFCNKFKRGDVGEIVSIVPKDQIMESELHIKWYNSESPQKYYTRIVKNRVEPITEEEFYADAIGLEKATGRRSSVKSGGIRSSSRRQTVTRRRSSTPQNKRKRVGIFQSVGMANAGANYI